MSNWGDLARQVIKVLETFLTAADRVAIDPQGTIQELGDLLVKWAKGSPETTSLLTRFQQEPTNSDVQTALRGRLTETLLDHPEFAKTLQDKLTNADSHSSNSASTFHQQGGVHTSGSSSISESTINTGSGSIKQRTIKIGNIRLPLPVFALILLLGGGAVADSGIAIVNASAGPTSHSYYVDNSGASGYSLTYVQWTEYQGGSIDGEIDHYNSGQSSGVNVPVHFTGHQNDTSVNFNWTELGYSVAGNGTLQDGHLTFYNLPHSTKSTEQLTSTTPEQFVQILDQAKKKAASQPIQAGPPLPGPMTPELAVQTVYKSVAIDDGTRACLGVLQPAASQQFAKDFGTNTCEQAIDQLSKKVADKIAYKDLSIPQSSVRTNSPSTATIYSCAIGIESGPSLGTFGLTNSGNGWFITAHTSDPATCPTS
jgi:hypothetical protein